MMPSSSFAFRQPQFCRQVFFRRHAMSALPCYRFSFSLPTDYLPAVCFFFLLRCAAVLPRRNVYCCQMFFSRRFRTFLQQQAFATTIFRTAGRYFSAASSQRQLFQARTLFAVAFCRRNAAFMFFSRRRYRIVALFRLTFHAFSLTFHLILLYFHYFHIRFHAALPAIAYTPHGQPPLPPH